jgi:hypothetical protein
VPKLNLLFHLRDCTVDSRIAINSFSSSGHAEFVSPTIGWEALQIGAWCEPLVCESERVVCAGTHTFDRGLR